MYVSSAAIRVHRVAKSFAADRGEVPVLAPITFDVEAGAWTTILGPSGCGKTTLLRILAGLLEPDAGQVSIGDAAGSAGRAAYLPQRDTLLPWRTALDNAILASEIEGGSLEQARVEAAELFARFGLSGFEDVYPSQLSGGMRQRLALIRTFLAHRDVLLLDEPLGALDLLTRATLQDWLLSVWTELRKTILLVTHDVEEALLLSDRIVVLSDRPASIARDLRVGLPRPRSRASAELAETKGRLLDLLLEER
jgi:ABC-type nitrate/sulfonate/bicarbonate transport system ATPase subunit